MNAGSGIAFFDVDGTLLSEKSVVSFYRFYLEQLHPEDSERRWDLFTRELAWQASCRVDRAALNRWFYETHFTGLEVATVGEVGREWFKRALQRPGFLIRTAARALVDHQAMGLRIV